MRRRAKGRRISHEQFLLDIRLGIVFLTSQLKIRQSQQSAGNGAILSSVSNAPPASIGHLPILTHISAFSDT